MKILTLSEKRKKIAEEKKRKNQIITKLEPAKIFYRAEEYHQNYFVKNNLGHYSL